MIFLPVAILALENDGDRAFMTGLYLDTRALMYKKAKRMLRGEQDVEDVINDALEALIKKIDLLKGFDSCTLRAYVVSTIRNTALNYLNHKKRQGERVIPDGDEALESIPARAAGLDADLIRKQDLDALKKALMLLPERERDLLTMKYLDELKDREIAAVFGIKPGSVRAYLTKARRHAQEVLKELMDDGR